MAHGNVPVGSVHTDRPSRGYEGFGGVVGELASQSKPWWPAPRRARPDAPNVIVVLVDDLGFSDLSPFGSEIRTSNIQSLADSGYCFTNYHSSPLCSPSRAALMTGINPHRAGFAMVAHVDPGFPGYNLEIAEDVPTLAESFRGGGYATFMVGKWHLTKESKLHDGAEKSSWPLQRGFDRYFGSMDGFTSLFNPHRIICDNSPLPAPEFPDDFYLTDEMTDRAIGMINGLRANDPDKPFFLYFAHQAVHGPVQAKPEDIKSYRGCYDSGWDAVREQRFARQLDLGLFPPGTRASASGPSETDGVPPWEDLDAEQKRLFARHMEIYAAAVDSVDQSVGRLIDHLTRMGEFDNSIIVVTSDNGATGEGGVGGTRSYFSQFATIAGLPEDWCTDVPRSLELMGGPQVHGHYPRGWAHASNTPFRYYKGRTYAGGIHVPFVLSWPAALGRDAGDTGIRDQYAYVTDLAPSLLELAGVEPVKQRHGRPVKEIDGVSFAHLLCDRTQDSHHLAQYVECGGERGYFEGNLKLIAPEMSTDLTGEGWELYDISVDPTETVNLAAQQPDKVKELVDKWRGAAWMNTVFPLDDVGTMLDVRPDSESSLSMPVTLYPGTPVLERFRSSKLTLLRSFAIDASLDYHPGDAGVVVAHGDQGGGYVLFLEDGNVRFTYNAYGAPTRSSAPVPATGRSVTLTVEFTALPEMRWRISLLHNGLPLILLDSVPQLLGMCPFTGISVAADYGGPVDWELHERHGVFQYQRGLNWVRYTPGEKADYNREIVLAIEDLAAREIE